MDRRSDARGGTRPPTASRCRRGRGGARLPTVGKPQLSARRQFGRLSQPGYDAPLDAEMGPALFEKISEPELRPAALMAADTVEVCCEILDISAAELDELVARGVLEVRETATR